MAGFPASFRNAIFKVIHLHKLIDNFGSGHATPQRPYGHLGPKADLEPKARFRTEAPPPLSQAFPSPFSLLSECER